MYDGSKCFTHYQKDDESSELFDECLAGNNY